MQTNITYQRLILKEKLSRKTNRGFNYNEVFLFVTIVIMYFILLCYFHSSLLTIRSLVKV